MTRPQGAAARTAVEVRMEGLRRHYGPVVALDGLDLTMAPGELVALLGPSGCGKTTTLRLVAGLEDADAGRITVGGKDVIHLPASKRDMGMVFQAYSLFPHMTVRQNVAFGLRLRRVSPAVRDRRALEMLELVGLSTQADRYPHQISGGQQQRVALARALALEPQVLRVAAAAVAGRQGPGPAAGPDPPDPARGGHHHAVRHPRPGGGAGHRGPGRRRSEEHTSELQSLR